ncbi:MAG: dTDP-4-dehydrorhamnose reductase [Planctomycetota bacterium]
MKILLTGRDGQIGQSLRRLLPDVGELVATSRAELNLADAASIRSAVREIQPDLIVNAAGYTNVDRAEREPHIAMAINANACRTLAESAADIGASLIHYSTDYIFDGRSSTPYTPTDSAAPLNAYGRSKLAGEQAIRACGVDHLIMRTSWVYSFHGRNFLRTMLALAREREALQIVHDQVGTPTWASTVAGATVAMIRTGWNDQTFGSMSGTYHVACTGQATWFEFAQAIFELARLERTPDLTPIPSSAYPTAAARPPWSVLDVTDTMTSFGIVLPTWRDALRESFEQAWSTDTLTESVERHS